MRYIIINISENWIIAEHLSIHRAKRFEKTHLEYSMMSVIYNFSFSILDKFNNIFIESSTFYSFYTYFTYDAERLQEFYDPSIVPSTTPAWSFYIDIFDLILATVTRYEYFYDIPEIDTSDIFFMPPTCDFAIFLRYHNNTCLIVTDSTDIQDDGIRFIHSLFEGYDLFKNNFPINELKFEVIYSICSGYIDESISWYTDMFCIMTRFEFELSYIVPSFYILESLGVRLKYPNTIPVENICI
jgi:hypothetical protein